MENKQRKGGRVSERQKNIIVDFMFENPNLNNGQFSSTFRHDDSVRLWADLVESLNSDGVGVSKTVEKWKASWRDMKLYVKEKASKMKASITKTGSGFASANPLTELEEKILSLMGISSFYGIPGGSKTGSEAFSEILADENGEIVIVNADMEDEEFSHQQVLVPSLEMENTKDSEETSSNDQPPNKKRKPECLQATSSAAQKLAKVIQSQNEVSADIVKEIKEIGKELVHIEKQKLVVEQERTKAKKEHQKIMQDLEREKLNEQRRTATAFEAILQELLAKKHKNHKIKTELLPMITAILSE